MRVAVLGERDPALLATLAAVLEPHGIEVSATLDARPDAILLLTVGHASSAAVHVARALGGGAPVVALMLFSDPELRERLCAAGADECHALDGPIVGLLTRLRRVVAAAAPIGG
jgi:hypothetical protein